MRYVLGCLAALLWLVLVSPFLEAQEQAKAKKEEKIQDIFEPSVRPKGPFISLKSDSREVDARLDGIGLGPRKAFAVINGKVYQQGEEKEGIEVAHIRKKEVDILINGAPETLALTHYEGVAGVRTAKKENEKLQS